MVELSDMRAAESIVVDAPPERLYELISDVSRMGDLSPECTSCWWDEGSGPAVGSWFTGHNVRPTREWDRRCEVIVADPPTEFAWMPGGVEEGIVRWGFTFVPTDGATRVEESWLILEMAPFFEEQTEEYLVEMIERTRNQIHDTLVALKRVAESP